MSHLPERLETYLCSFVSQSTKYAFELEAGAPGELLASTLLLWTKTAATENIRCAAVNAICGLISASEGAREKISGQNGLQIVADCLHISKTENGVSACAQTLTALVRVSRDRRLLCCHRHAVNDLVQASQMRAEATSRKCVACLKEIALEYSCHQVLLKCSTVEATSIFLRKRPADAVAKLLLILWHNLSCTKSSWARFGPHLDILSVYLNHSASAMQSLTLCILCNVLSHHDNCEHFARQTIFKSVMDRCSPLSALGVSTKACYALQNALRFSAQCRTTFAEKGGVNLMMKLVLIYEENDIRESAMTVSLMVMQQNPKESMHAVSSITPLLEILSYDLSTFEVAIRALKILTFVAKTDDSTRQKIVAVNAINVVVNMFEIPDKLGDKVIWKNHKDGDRFLALKLATAFMSLLSHSKKVLPRLASHGGLAMIISVLAEHSTSGLPEEVVVNASIFLANFSADRQGLNDIVSTCGIPVILKSAVAIATVICSSNNESHSPYRMRKFPALRGLPGSPHAAPVTSEFQSRGNSNSQQNINPDIKNNSAIEVADSNSSHPQKYPDGRIESLDVGIVKEPVANTEPIAISTFTGEPCSISMVDDLNTTPENFVDLATDAAIFNVVDERSKSIENESWLSSIGISVASRTMKLIIGASMIKFEIYAAVESCMKDIIDRIEGSTASNEKFLKAVEQSIQTPNANVAIDSASHHSDSFVQKQEQDNNRAERDNVKVRAEFERTNIETSLRAVVENVVELAEELIERKRQEERGLNDRMISDDAAWANDIDAEDVWGKYESIL
jgi:hypothetical protein